MERYSIEQLYKDVVLKDFRAFPYPLAPLPRPQINDVGEYILPTPGTANQGADYALVEVLDSNQYEVNEAGAKLLYPFTFTAPDGASYRLPNAPLVRVEGRKNIVTTATAGRNGTVKELIQTEDWRVLIRGVVFPSKIGNTVSTPQYPFDELEKLVKIFKIGAALKTESRILKAYGITQVVVERFNVPATPGMQGVLFYELDCLSDTDDDLVIIRNV